MMLSICVIFNGLCYLCF